MLGGKGCWEVRDAGGVHVYCISFLPALSHAEVLSGEESLAQFMTDVHNFTRYQSFRELSGLTYGDQTSNCCIVSSLEFDKDGEFFAVAGVTKKIKVSYFKDTFVLYRTFSVFCVHLRIASFASGSWHARHYSQSIS